MIETKITVPSDVKDMPLAYMNPELTEEAANEYRILFTHAQEMYCALLELSPGLTLHETAKTVESCQALVRQIEKELFIQRRQHGS